MERTQHSTVTRHLGVGSGPAGHRQRRSRPTTLGLLALLLVTAIVLSACAAVDDLSGSTSGADDAWTATEDAGEAPEAAPDEAVDRDVAEVAEDAEDAGPAGDDSPAARSEVGAGRAVIRTAHMHIRARDTATAADDIVALVEASEGYVSGTDLARDADGVVSGRLTLRVPTEELTTTLDAIDELADSVLERRLDEQDVTTELSDLDARITNLEAYEEELRQLLTEVRESTTDTEDLLRVFDRVNEVRGEIDQATARRTVLADQVAMSTIHLQLSPTPATGPVTDPGWAPGDTARGALATTMRILADLADTVIRIGLTVLPVTLVVLIPIALVVWLVRRVVVSRQRRSAAADGTAATQGAPAATPQEPGTAPQTAGTTPPAPTTTQEDATAAQGESPATEGPPPPTQRSEDPPPDRGHR